MAVLEHGWLKHEMDDVAAYGRAKKRVLHAAAIAKSFGYTRPSTVEFPQDELRALAYMFRLDSRGADNASTTEQAKPRT